MQSPDCYEEIKYFYYANHEEAVFTSHERNSMSGFTCLPNDATPCLPNNNTKWCGWCQAATLQAGVPAFRHLKAAPRFAGRIYTHNTFARKTADTAIVEVSSNKDRDQQYTVLQPPRIPSRRIWDEHFSERSTVLDRK